MKTIQLLNAKTAATNVVRNMPLSAARLHVVDLSVPVRILSSNETNSQCGSLKKKLVLLS